jgi:cell division protein ZapE
MRPGTPLTRYRADLASGEIQHDDAQEKAVAQLQDLYDRLVVAESRRSVPLLSKLFTGGLKKQKPINGLYFWGGVGRGKTYLVDTFFDCLSFKARQRMHFHLFMRRVHNELRGVRDQENPLGIVARKLALDLRVLCFDEFVINDVADAVILGRLMQELFAYGVTLVATSNIAPDDLYQGGLQRDLFLPAIALIKKYTRVFHLDGDTDYRLQFLDSAEIYFTPLSDGATNGLRYNFDHIAPDAGRSGVTTEINGRPIPTLRLAEGVVWFDFGELCGGARSQIDYIELARCFHTILLSDIPLLDKGKDDEARRLINLVDIMYDHNVNLLISAEESPEKLYQGKRLAREFLRTASRMTEMRSHAYLAKAHAG